MPPLSSWILRALQKFATFYLVSQRAALAVREEAEGVEMGQKPRNAIKGKQGFQRTGRTDPQGTPQGFFARVWQKILNIFGVKTNQQSTLDPNLAARKYRYTSGTESALVGSSSALRNITPSGISDSVSKTHNKFSELKPEWVKAAPFPLLNTSQGDNFVLLVDHSIEESERIVGDRVRSSLVKKETAELYLRGEEVKRTTRAPGIWSSVVKYPTYTNEDGSCVATRINRGDFGSSQENGIVSASGEFTPDTGAFSDVFRDRIGEPGCPLYDELDGYPDDWQIKTVTNDRHEVLGLHISASCEEVELDDADLIDPDAGWDSRFD